MEKNQSNFQPIDSDIKRYEEIRKLTTGKGELLVKLHYWMFIRLRIHQKSL